MKQIQIRCNPNFMETGVQVPTCPSSAHKICGDSKYGVYDNLPCPQVYNVGGHAYMRIKGVLQHHFVEGRGYEFTETPPIHEGDPSVRVNYKIHGSVAVAELIEEMKEMDKRPYDERKVYYGWITLWSD